MSYDVNDTTSLSRLYHLNSEPWVNENPVPNAPFLQMTKSYANAARIALPETPLGTVDALARARKSQRAFVDAPMALETFAALLRTAYAAADPATDKSSSLLRRPVRPSFRTRRSQPPGQQAHGPDRGSGSLLLADEYGSGAAPSARAVFQTPSYRTA